MTSLDAVIRANVAARIAEGERAHSNLRSWARCYRTFADASAPKDRLSLELGYFLASWGMMRGSSFLKSCDYTVHEGAVALVTEKSAMELRSLGLVTRTVATVLDLKEALEQHYVRALPDRNPVNVSHTLSSKILLATLGIVPAYDRFFRAGLRKHGLSLSFSKVSLNELIAFEARHRSALDATAIEFEPKIGFRLPYMRIIDMHFFSEGAGYNLRSTPDLLS